MTTTSRSPTWHSAQTLDVLMPTTLPIQGITANTPIGKTWYQNHPSHQRYWTHSLQQGCSYVETPLKARIGSFLFLTLGETIKKTGRKEGKSEERGKICLMWMCIEFRAVNEQADVIEGGRLHMSWMREAKGTIYIFWSSAPKNLVDSASSRSKNTLYWKKNEL